MLGLEYAHRANKIRAQGMSIVVTRVCVCAKGMSTYVDTVWERRWNLSAKRESAYRLRIPAHKVKEREREREERVKEREKREGMRERENRG